MGFQYRQKRCCFSPLSLFAQARHPGSSIFRRVCEVQRRQEAASRQPAKPGHRPTTQNSPHAVAKAQQSSQSLWWAHHIFHKIHVLYPRLIFIPRPFLKTDNSQKRNSERFLIWFLFYWNFSTYLRYDFGWGLQIMCYLFKSYKEFYSEHCFHWASPHLIPIEWCLCHMST